MSNQYEDMKLIFSHRETDIHQESFVLKSPIMMTPWLSDLIMNIPVADSSF